MSKRLKSSSPLTRTKIDDLPEVLLVDILCRIPSRLIFLCKLVSKPWYSLISTPQFVDRYLCGQLPPAISLIITSDHPAFKTRARNFSLNFLPCYHQARGIKKLAKGHILKGMLKPGSVVPPVVVGTYNDLVLCCATMNYQRHYYLCNPYTKQWVALPSTPRVYRNVLVGFVCDPYLTYSNDDDHNGEKEQRMTSSSSVIRNADYKWKVVRVVPNPSYPYFHFEIFSSETRQWREIFVGTYARIRVISSTSSSFSLASDDWTTMSSVAYKGMLYWWCKNGRTLELDVSSSNTAKYRFIAPPEELESDFESVNGIGSLGVSGGRLHLCMHEKFSGDQGEVKQAFQVWELKQVVNGRWLADRVTIASKDIEVCYPNIRVLAFHPNNEDVLYFRKGFEIATCNLNGGKLEKTSESPVKGIERRFYYSFSLPWLPTPVPKRL
ncbi:hypothetical protein ACLB2K_010109 [Fragaria x ananassa]